VAVLEHVLRNIFWGHNSATLGAQEIGREVMGLSSHTTMRSRLAWLLTVFVVASGAYGQQVIFVDDDAAGANDGSSWSNAFVFLQDALAQVASGDEIWVAAGTYRPDQGFSEVVAGLDRDASFRLVDGVALYGGFAGIETSIKQRDVEANLTVLSGDLMGNDVPVACTDDLPDCVATGRRCFNESCILKDHIGDNSYTVVLALGVSAATVLDGFTITGGYANAPNGDASFFGPREIGRASCRERV